MQPYERLLATLMEDDERIVVMVRRLPVAYAGGGQLSLAEREGGQNALIECQLLLLDDARGERSTRSAARRPAAARSRSRRAGRR